VRCRYPSSRAACSRSTTTSGPSRLRS
jgi:hypothetical protein